MSWLSGSFSSLTSQQLLSLYKASLHCYYHTKVLRKYLSKRNSEKTFKWGHSKSAFVPKVRSLINDPNNGAMKADIYSSMISNFYMLIKPLIHSGHAYNSSEKRQNLRKFGQKCAKFEDILKKGRWLLGIITHCKLLEKALNYLWKK